MKAVYLALNEMHMTRLGALWAPLAHYKPQLLLIKSRVMYNTINSLAEEKCPCVPIMPLQLLQVYFDLTSKTGRMINFTRRAYCYRSLCKVLRHQKVPYRARMADEGDAPWRDEELAHSPVLSKALGYTLANCDSYTSSQFTSASTKIQLNSVPTSIFEEV